MRVRVSGAGEFDAESVSSLAGIKAEVETGAGLFVSHDLITLAYTGQAGVLSSDRVESPRAETRGWRQREVLNSPIKARLARRLT